MHLLILDVDGTLVITQSGATFRKTADDWQWLPGRVEKLKELREQGVKIALATNQAGVAFPWSRFTEAEMQAEIEAVAREIGAEYIGVCYSTPNEKALPAYRNANDAKRKPGPGMLLEAMRYYGVSPKEALMVGDREEDEQAAQNCGVGFMLAEKFFEQ